MYTAISEPSLENHTIVCALRNENDRSAFLVWYFSFFCSNQEKWWNGKKKSTSIDDWGIDKIAGIENKEKKGKKKIRKYRKEK